MNFETYPFEKLQRLLAPITFAKKSCISLTIGEPQFQTPLFLQQELAKHAATLNKYPKSLGEDFLIESLLVFIQQRYGITLENGEILPTFGTREALFNFPQFFLFDKEGPTLAYPNPFYQIYEGAAIASRARVFLMNLQAHHDFKPHLSKQEMEQCHLVILNSPNNPTGSTLSLQELKEWVGYALEYDFVLLNDECYSEIYHGQKPPSLLEASEAIGNKKFKNVLVVNSLSKRSSAPSLRSGFIAGDAQILAKYAKYRTYLGCALPLPLQYVASLAWREGEHVEGFRKQYASNMQQARDSLGVWVSEASFYVWLFVGDDLEFTKNLASHEHVLSLPGRFLSREYGGVNPGEGYVRLALVYEEEIIQEALARMKKWC